MARIKINAQLCQRCGLCVEICPEGLFSQAQPAAVPKVRHPERCSVCGHCTSTCPSGALEHADFPPEDYEGR